MSQILTLSDDVYRKLAHGAAERGVSIESLLSFASDVLTLPKEPTPSERRRSQVIDALFAKHRKSALTDRDRNKLGKLIDADYDDAIARAERLIATKANGTRAKSTRK